MMGILLIPLWWAAFPAAPDNETRDDKVRRLVEEIDRSGQVLMIAEKADDRAEPPPRLAPGDPPLLAFRYFEGQSKHRFGQLDLVMDDAGH
jgi:hypothetical protein